MLGPGGHSESRPEHRGLLHAVIRGPRASAQRGDRVPVSRGSSEPPGVSLWEVEMSPCPSGTAPTGTSPWEGCQGTEGGRLEPAHSVSTLTSPPADKGPLRVPSVSPSVNWGCRCLTV